MVPLYFRKIHLLNPVAGCVHAEALQQVKVPAPSAPPVLLTMLRPMTRSYAGFVIAVTAKAVAFVGVIVKNRPVEASIDIDAE